MHVMTVPSYASHHVNITILSSSPNLRCKSNTASPRLRIKFKLKLP